MIAKARDGRTCRRCRAKLSIYNLDAHCHVCLRANFLDNAIKSLNGTLTEGESVKLKLHRVEK